MMRWWWFGPEVSRADIERDLTTMAEAGIGGVEVAYVYPLAEHPNRLGSAEFLADLAYAADVAERLGLRFDVTLGSGWSFGGPHIGPEHAARGCAGTAARSVPARSRSAAGSRPGRAMSSIGVYLGAGSIQERPETYRPLPIGADGSVDIPAGTGTRVVLTATAGLTGQNVKRAAAGAEGPVHDHYDADAVRHASGRARRPAGRRRRSPHDLLGADHALEFHRDDKAATVAPMLSDGHLRVGWLPFRAAWQESELFDLEPFEN